MFVRAAGTVINRCGKRSSAGTRESVSLEHHVRGSHLDFRNVAEHLLTAGREIFTSHESTYPLAYPCYVIWAKFCGVIWDRNAKGRECSATFRGQGIQSVCYLDQQSSGRVRTR